MNLSLKGNGKMIMREVVIQNKQQHRVKINNENY